MTRSVRSPEEERVLWDIGERIRAARLDRGMTQMDLAHRAGLHATYIGQVENGHRNLALLNLYRIAAALEVQVAALLPEPLGTKPLPPGGFARAG